MVNYDDGTSGAAKAALRLHRALRKKDIDSRMLVQKKSGDDPLVMGPESKIKKAMTEVAPAVDALPSWFYRGRRPGIFSSAWAGLPGVVDKINGLKPDIVHLHWINAGMMSLRDITKINAPVVWSLHDQWAFTGGCHLSWGCDAYTGGCGKCPALASGKENDISRRIWQRKLSAYSGVSNLTILGLSGWMKTCADQSGIFGNAAIRHLPNVIDTGEFAPVDTVWARKVLGLPAHGKLVLFSGSSATRDTNKGYQYLIEAMGKLNRQDIQLCVLGSQGVADPSPVEERIKYLGIYSDDASMKLVYSAADLLIVPSRQENLSCSIMEAMSCGTPVVAFDTGGNKDLIAHLQNGYLVKPFDTDDLAKGIEWIFTQDAMQLAESARKAMIEQYDSDLLVAQYQQLYESILNRAVS